MISRLVGIRPFQGRKRRRAISGGVAPVIKFHAFSVKTGTTRPRRGDCPDGLTSVETEHTGIIRGTYAFFS